MYTAVYLRSSRRDPVALAQQQKLLTQICLDKGWEYQVFKDEAVGDTCLDRPGLKKLLAEAGAGRIDRVLVTGFDRIAKKEEELQEVLAQLRECGVTVVDWYLNSPQFQSKD